MTLGQSYVFQTIAVDNRSAGRIADFGNQDGGDLDDIAISTPQLVTGTFTASGISQIFLIGNHVPSDNNAQLAGYQLRAVPEPSSTALLGLGGLALILRRRK